MSRKDILWVALVLYRLLLSVRTWGTGRTTWVQAGYVAKLNRKTVTDYKVLMHREEPQLSTNDCRKHFPFCHLSIRRSHDSYEILWTVICHHLDSDLEL